MAYKNALADLPLGGGKAVLNLPDCTFDRRRLFAAFGRAIAELEGAYVTAEDVGTNVADMTTVREQTYHVAGLAPAARSEEHTSELQSLMRISYAVFCLKKKT